MSLHALARRYGGKRTHVRVTIEVWRDRQLMMKTQIGRSPEEDTATEKTSEPPRGLEPCTR